MRIADRLPGLRVKEFAAAAPPSKPPPASAHPFVPPGHDALLPPATLKGAPG
jgi:hypothetical protein